MQKKIHFIITGGTIDKVYDPVSQITRMAPESIIPLYLKNAINPALHDISYETLFMVDSNEITESMRKKILHAITSSKENWVIITHGTDTMSVTAEFLKDHLPPTHGRTIIFTGSMTPLREFTLSDGGFNLGYAISSLEHLDPGIYMAMHAQIFPAGDVLKDRATARFEFKGI
ncbi:MAG: asparaginase [Alphaproteobacteria bacterium PRO2]|nr:asparaginase [Alphaproteobacteria bacterium PRO2]